MSKLPTPTINSPALSLLATATFRAAGIDLEELPSAEGSIPDRVTLDRVVIHVQPCVL
jgi:hypothetical protein